MIQKFGGKNSFCYIQEIFFFFFYNIDTRFSFRVQITGFSFTSEKAMKLLFFIFSDVPRQHWKNGNPFSSPSYKEPPRKDSLFSFRSPEGKKTRISTWFFEGRLVLGKERSLKHGTKERRKPPKGAKVRKLYKKKKRKSVRVRERERKKEYLVVSLIFFLFFETARSSRFSSTMNKDDEWKKKRDSLIVYSYDYIFVWSLKRKFVFLMS